MNTIKSLMISFGIFLSVGLQQHANAFIRIDSDGPVLDIPLSGERETRSDVESLVGDLARITGLRLYVQKGYVRVSTASLGSDTKTTASETARSLFMSAIESVNVYKIRVARDANLGRVLKGDMIELDFLDQKYLRFRGVPKEAFSTSMIFFHELVHRHLALPDPTLAEIRADRNAKGQTVEFMNRIERELNLPERGHYFPRKNPVPGSAGFCIFFGDGSKRIEIDEEIFRPLLQTSKNQGYAGLLRK